jgi:hypothetical protein
MQPNPEQIMMADMYMGLFSYAYENRVNKHAYVLRDSNPNMKDNLQIQFR